ncbi:phenylalanine--tRNA ligase subunit beta [Desulfobulbus alkaliphilus]|uniref:phenylalanine--tRNA ligase subunit beta n=1 Tax=Desulfobulbus alkaliphilus TaxID=869814 RepID=UPI001963FE4E|nr:phenylalanine--tRNA ligase subunit beta [Desulfobulbus alkaliphilus]MBM9536236.1 phenylalanine--tRNA ligase subunit beta [Desulfobulbus alkaliphilus]
MKFTLSWLNQFIPTEGLSPAQLADKLTMLGLEVDAVTELHVDLEEIITARVTTVTKHPDADKLTVCMVDTGSEEIQVVCGAPNVSPGMLSALARPGIRLPDGTRIKKSKVRGVASAGMLCSAKELGISEDHGGILDLNPDLSTGQSLAKALSLRDTVIEVDLTPNRPDCASVRGIAREVGGFTGGVLRPLVESTTPLTGTDVGFEVHIQAPDLCPRYAARRLTNVTIGPSPQWMQRQLIAVGMRPINNIVDITNFVMLESGQPLHAFDFETLQDAQIVVRRPHPHETSLTTLDGQERTLDPEMLLICDGRRPVALAGVMGGLETEITSSTTTILLESACFNPVSIRRTARNLGIPSEASYRFERGVDPELAASALERAVNLMVQYAGAQADLDGIDAFPGKKPLVQLHLRLERVRTLLGISLAIEEVARYLRGIEFIVTALDGQTLEVTVPSFRVDIEREIDLIEEIARLYGYNEIPATQPVIRMDYPRRDDLRSIRQETARILTSQGFYEAINYSFVPESHLDHCRLAETDPRRRVTRLINPLSEEQAIMRSMLLPGMLENIRRNISFQRSDIRLFETGKIFLQHEANVLPEERLYLCAVISGCRHPEAEPLYYSSLHSDFLDIKGTAVNLLRVLRISGHDTSRIFQTGVAQPYCDPDCAAVIKNGEQIIGSLGAVHRDTLKEFDIKQPVYFFEIDLHQLLTMSKEAKKFSPLPRYPSIRRDMSLVVPDSVAAGDLLEAIHAQQQKYVESADIFDVYRGNPIEPGYKSVSLSITYRSAATTLDDQTVDKIHDKIVNSLMASFSARYREGSEE